MQRLGRNIVTTEQNGSSSTTIRKHAIKIPSRFLEIIAIRDQNMGEKGGRRARSDNANRHPDPPETKHKAQQDEMTRKSTDSESRAGGVRGRATSIRSVAGRSGVDSQNILKIRPRVTHRARLQTAAARSTVAGLSCAGTRSSAHHDSPS